MLFNRGHATKHVAFGPQRSQFRQLLKGRHSHYGEVSATLLKYQSRCFHHVLGVIMYPGEIVLTRMVGCSALLPHSAARFLANCNTADFDVLYAQVSTP